MRRVVHLVVGLLCAALVYCGWRDHQRLVAIDAYLSAVVGTRQSEDGTLAPLNRADGLAVLLYEALSQAAKR